ncbi:hypothetical protein ACFL6H_03840 [Candidatus Latescibacterota bacterium]
MSFCIQVFAQNTPEGTAWVSSHGYSGCVRLFNKNVSVILEPNCGGRVIEYNFNGDNVLYIDPEQDGWTYTPGERTIGPCGGRFDIGPENLVPRRPNLWVGKWTAEITGPRSAKMTSIEDESTGVQLIREFVLESNSSHLSCKQTIKNISDSTKQYNHWSRTFAVGGGVCLVPLSEGSRFPLGYIYYGPGSILNYRHKAHPNINVRDNFLEITKAPPQKKFGIDSYAGWFGYVTPGNLLFVKKFPVYPNRVYGELAAYTISIWYNEDINCELEPIGPRETLEPGQSASFTEEWWLLNYKFPIGDEKVDIKAFTRYVEDNTR